MRLKVDKEQLAKRVLHKNIVVTSRFIDFKDFQAKEFEPQYSVGEIAFIEKEEVFYQKIDKGWKLLLRTGEAKYRIHPDGCKVSRKVTFEFGRLHKLFTYIKGQINNKQ